jgi:hypothetical protein
MNVVDAPLLEKDRVVAELDRQPHGLSVSPAILEVIQGRRSAEDLL